MGYPDEPVEQGILDRVLDGFEAGRARELRVDARGRRRRTSRELRERRAAGAGRAEPGRLHHRDRARHPGRAGAHPRRIAPRQRRAAQDGAGRRPARRADVRRSRRREGARARRCSGIGWRSRPSSSWKASPPTPRCDGIIEKIEAPRDRRCRPGAGSSAPRRWRSLAPLRLLRPRPPVCCSAARSAAGSPLLLDDWLDAPAPRDPRRDREAPAAFAVGRAPRGALPLAPSSRGGRLTLEVREQPARPARRGRHAHAPAGGAAAGEGLEERLRAASRAGAARDEGGALAIRALGPARARVAAGDGRCYRGRPRSTPASPTAPLRALPLQVPRRREAGLRTIRRPGEGRLFEGLREWVPGRRDPDHRLEGDGAPRQADRAAVRGRAAAAGADRDRRRPACSPRRWTACRGSRRWSRRRSSWRAPRWSTTTTSGSWSSPTRCSATSRRLAGAAALRAVLEGLAHGRGPARRVGLPRGLPLPRRPQPQARADGAVHRRDRPDRERRAGRARRDAPPPPSPARRDAAGSRPRGARRSPPGVSRRGLRTGGGGGAARRPGGGSGGDAGPWRHGARRSARLRQRGGGRALSSD